MIIRKKKASATMADEKDERAILCVSEDYVKMKMKLNDKMMDMEVWE